MKKTIIFILFSASYIIGQVAYVDIQNPIYSFLDRMDAENFIENYDQFEIPKTRKEISRYLKQIIEKRNKLNSIDSRKLNDFLVDFEYDIYGSTKDYYKLFSSMPISNLTSENEKFLYYYTDSNKVDLFINFLGEGIYLSEKHYESDQITNASIFRFGGVIRGSAFERVGFSIKGTNGSFFGDRDLANTYGGLRYNYKINVWQDGIGNDYFDDTEGYLFADFDYAKIKIGRDRMKLGYGIINPILSDNYPPNDYLGFNLNYKALSFSFYHMKLFGEASTVGDSIQGAIRTVDDKYMVYHRLGINFSRHFTFGVGEVLLYANRNIDLSYLNPFNFYASVEHANQDRDNSMLFFDATNNSIDGLKFFATLLVDDIDFGKIGTGWYGNQTLLSLSAYSSQLNHIVPVDLSVQYLRIDPYVYTHRIFNNNYSSLSYPLVENIEPNSESYIFKIGYRPHYRVDLGAVFYYSNHGANVIDSDGNVIVNNGGDILVGHRPEDSENVNFLNGPLEVKRVYTFSAAYEPINNYMVKFYLQYVNSNFVGGKENYLRTNLGIFLNF